MVTTPKKRVFVVGVGMTKFTKPGSSGKDYTDLVKEAVLKALADAKLQYKDIEEAVVGYIYGDTCSGQRCLYELGMTGIPIYNVNNACASGSSGLSVMKRFIESGSTDVGLCVGFEKMTGGSLENMPSFQDRIHPFSRHMEVVSETYGMEPHPMMAQMFGNAGREHMKKYGTTVDHFARIAWKNHKHSVNNPNSQFQKEYSLEEIKNSKMVHDPLTRLMCSPTSDGSAAAILCSEDFLRSHPGLKDQAVEILGLHLGTDLPSAFTNNIQMVGFDLARVTAEKVYKQTGLGPSDVQVIELHDCFAPNELLAYEALGLCPIGEGGKIVERGDNTYGGRWVINPSGGLISKGHPIGATGVAQCVELSLHLRGEAGKRQVPNATLGLQHNIGIGGACFVAMYKLAFPKYPSGPGSGRVTDSSSKKSLISGGAEETFKSDKVFQQIKDRGSQEGAEVVKKVAASYRFIVTGGPNGKKKEWTVDLKALPLFVGQRDGKVDCEITISDGDLIDVAMGKLRADQAFMQGKMKLKGNMAKAMKLREILNASKYKAKL